jgi:hypothetical protein
MPRAAISHGHRNVVRSIVSCSSSSVKRLLHIDQIYFQLLHKYFFTVYFCLYIYVHCMIMQKGILNAYRFCRCCIRNKQEISLLVDLRSFADESRQLKMRSFTLFITGHTIFCRRKTYTTNTRHQTANWWSRLQDHIIITGYARTLELFILPREGILIREVWNELNIATGEFQVWLVRRLTPPGLLYGFSV